MNEWSVPLNEGDAAPVVSKGRVLVADAAFTPEGTDAHRVLCLDLETGNILWQTTYAIPTYATQDISAPYPVRPLASPCVAGNHVIQVDFGGTIHSLRFDDGSVAWERNLVTEFGAKPIQYGWSGRPWTDGEQVVVACGGDQALLIAFKVSDGSVLWTSGRGEASYTTPILISEEVGTEIPRSSLVYAAGDELISIDPTSGQSRWTYRYPKSGLTNAVTPIATSKNELLIAGQGMGASTKIRIDAVSGYSDAIQKLWSNNKFNPFYCNWIWDPKQNLILGFAGKTLHAVDAESGRTLWQQRGWTDANVVPLESEWLIVRGDGVLARASVDAKGIQVKAVSTAVQDRVWAAPVVVGKSALVRGRSKLVRLDLEGFAPSMELPKGVEVTSMDAMYGEKPRAIQVLIDASQGKSGSLEWNDYESVVVNPSLRLSDADYEAILNGLRSNEQGELALRIAEDWYRRRPFSIPSVESRILLERELGDASVADRIAQERLTSVEFVVEVPIDTPDNAKVYLAGNAEALGPWQPNQAEVTKSVDGRYRGRFRVPSGDLEFKFTLGSWDLEEVRADGRSISNRRLRIQQDATIDVKVQNWKSPQPAAK